MDGNAKKAYDKKSQERFLLRIKLSSEFYNCVTFYNTRAADHNFSHPALYFFVLAPLLSSVMKRN